MNNFVVGKEYTDDFIEKHLSDYYQEEHGADIIGNRFLVIDDDYDNTISFILTGATSKKYIWKCVYNDTDPKPELVKKSYVILTAGNELMATGYLETPDEIAATVAKCKECRPDVEIILFESVNSL